MIKRKKPLTIPKDSKRRRWHYKYSSKSDNMAYNNRNLLNKIIEIQLITQREFSRGVPYTYIYRTLIKEQYHISYSTFNNYLSRNAKKELELLNRKEAERKRQLTFEF